MTHLAGLEPATAPTGLPGLTHVHHVAYTVPDLDQAVAFFTDVLGATPLYREGPIQDPGGTRMRDRLAVHPRARADIAMLALPDGTRLELFEYRAPDQVRRLPANSDWGGHHLALHVDDIQAAAGYLRAQPGVEVLGDPETIQEGPIAGNTWVYFRTPWGMQLELVKNA